MKEHKKTESENGVINEFTFCFGSPIEKTNSVWRTVAVVLLYFDEYPKEKKIVSDQPCLCSGKSGYPAKIHPVDFEKDDDSNFHMDFIVACSNLRLGLNEM